MNPVRIIIADDDEIGFDARVHFDEGVRGDAIAPLFHVAEVVGRPAFEQAQVAGNCQHSPGDKLAQGFNIVDDTRDDTPHAITAVKTE